MDKQLLLTRRAAILGAAAASLSVGQASAAPANMPKWWRLFLPAIERPPAFMIRASAAGLPADHPVLESYRTAITRMQALPSSDPRNWARIAQIHNDHCAHQNWYIWPWHRAYLSSFERICQQLSGNSQFRVPYWDWTANRQIPLTFMQETFGGAPNPLFNRTRAPSQNDSLPENVFGPGNMDTIIGEPNFEAFMSLRPTGQTNTDASWQRVFGVQGPLEGGPHNYVHSVFIRGDMATFMSPLDPIFWLHHANLDRIWDFWNRLGNANTTDPLWQNFRFSGQFINPDGTPWEPLVSELLDIRALGYTYNLGDILFPPGRNVFGFVSQFDWNQLIRMGSSAGSSSVGNRIVTTRNPLAFALRTALPLEQLFAQLLRPSEEATEEGLPVAGRALVLIEAELATKAISPEVRVFLNCEYLSPETPPVDPHYVGSFSFFPSGEDARQEHRDHVRGAALHLLDLTLTLIALRDANRLPTDQLVLQLQPVALNPQEEPAPLSVRSVELVVTPKEKAR